jgi:hypothetical protein
LPFVASNVPLILLLLLINIILGKKNVEKWIAKCASDSLEVFTMNRVIEMQKLYTMYKYYVKESD